MEDTIFLTGGSGLLAINWAMTVRESRRVVLGLHHRTISLPGAETHRVDLDSVDDIVRALDATEPRLVVHTAALTSVEQCEREPDLARHVNVDLAMNVALACAKARVRLVHISTDHLFAGGPALFDESDHVIPVNVYARTKADAENLVLDANPSALVVRTNFYGWGPGYRGSFSDTIIGSLRAGETVTLFADVHYTPIVEEALTHAVHDLVDRGAAGIFHVTGDDRVSKHEFGLKVAAEFGLDAGLIREGTLAGQQNLMRRPGEMSLSNRKASTLLGRKLGGVDTHLAALHEQERRGRARELHAL